jgi:putative endonuclease
MQLQFVYVIKCSDGSYYTGCTHNLEERLARHSLGQIQYTKLRLPVELVTYVAFTNKYKAFEFEKYLKSGSGIAIRNKHLL